MAFDTSPTRNKNILAVAAVTVALLLGIKVALDSYFIQMTEETQKMRMASPDQLIAQRADEQKALATVGIDAVMLDLARRGRNESPSTGPVDISPRQSDDTGSLTGWSKMPRPVVAGPKMGSTIAPSNTATAAPAQTGAAHAPTPHH